MVRLYLRLRLFSALRQIREEVVGFLVIGPLVVMGFWETLDVVGLGAGGLLALAPGGDAGAWRLAGAVPAGVAMLAAGVHRRAVAEDLRLGGLGLEYRLARAERLALAWLVRSSLAIPWAGLSVPIAIRLVGQELRFEAWLGATLVWAAAMGGVQLLAARLPDGRRAWAWAGVLAVAWALEWRLAFEAGIGAWGSALNFILLPPGSEGVAARVALAGLAVAGPVLLAYWTGVGERELSPAVSGLGAAERVADLPAWFGRLAPPSRAGALFRRDLRLIRRGFSVAVPIHGLCAAFCLLAYGLLVEPARWSPREVDALAMLACTAATFSLTSVSARLARAELPYQWIERSHAVQPADVWTARVRWANCVGVPVAALVLGVLFMRGHPLPLIPTGLRLLAIAVQTASVTAAMSFVMVRHPVLANLLAAAVVTVLSLLFLAHWLMFLLFFVVIWPTLRSSAAPLLYLPESRP